MPSGGHTHSGPAPDPNALRRDRPADKAQWITLPSRRDGPLPVWPLSAATARERVLWADVWTMPQAVMWDANRQYIEIAIYIRTLRDAEKSKAAATTRTLLRQQQEALGLSLPGLARLHWRIEGEAVTAKRTDDPARRTARERFKVISQAS